MDAPSLNCEKCGDPVTRAESFETGNGKYLCSSCFIEKAQSRRSVSGEDLKRLRTAVKEELAGLLPRGALKDLVEDGYRRILLQRESLDEVSGWVVNEIERMAGLAACRRVLGFIQGMREAMSGGLDDGENEVREQIRRLADLGTK